MDILFTSLTPIVLGSLALLGYLFGRRQRKVSSATKLELTSKLDQTNVLIAQVESVSDELRRVMASHHSTVARCCEQIQVLNDSHSGNTDQAHHMQLQDVLGPTKRLTDDIAHAYDELRQHSHKLKRLRSRESH